MNDDLDKTFDVLRRDSFGVLLQKLEYEKQMGIFIDRNINHSVKYIKQDIENTGWTLIEISEELIKRGYKIRCLDDRKLEFYDDR
jgi:hypothetical protein